MKTRIITPFIGMYIFNAMKKEAKQLANGWQYEPVSFYEKNESAVALENEKPGAVTESDHAGNLILKIRYDKPAA